MSSFLEYNLNMLDAIENDIPTLNYKLIMIFVLVFVLPC